jgi:Zn finger protein HypA/HybF involved in hydrogenase expression
MDNVSQLTVKDGASESISVSKATGEQCPRCRNYYAKLEPVGEFKLCPRCAAAVKGEDK